LPGATCSTALSALTFHDPPNPQWFKESFMGALNTWMEFLCTFSDDAKFCAWRYPIYVSGDRSSVQSGAASIPTPDTLVVPARPAAWFLRQKFLDDALDFAIIAFPKVVVPNSPSGVDEILGRPRSITKRLPDPILAVDGERENNVQIAHGIFYVHRFVLERKLRRVHTDHDQARIPILCGLGLHIGQGPQRVDAGVSPEINQYHLSAKRLAAQGI
jgi:hypothetical protein